jgi:hypothetical protein
MIYIVVMTKEEKRFHTRAFALRLLATVSLSIIFIIRISAAVYDRKKRVIVHRDTPAYQSGHCFDTTFGLSAE